MKRTLNNAEKTVTKIRENVRGAGEDLDTLELALDECEQLVASMPVKSDR